MVKQRKFFDFQCCFVAQQTNVVRDSLAKVCWFVRREHCTPFQSLYVNCFSIVFSIDFSDFLFKTRVILCWSATIQPRFCRRALYSPLAQRSKAQGEKTLVDRVDEVGESVIPMVFFRFFARSSALQPTKPA